MEMQFEKVITASNGDSLKLSFAKGLITHFVTLERFRNESVVETFSCPIGWFKVLFDAFNGEKCGHFRFTYEKVQTRNETKYRLQECSRLQNRVDITWGEHNLIKQLIPVLYDSASYQQTLH